MTAENLTYKKWTWDNIKMTIKRKLRYYWYRITFGGRKYKMKNYIEYEYYSRLDEVFKK